MQSVAPRAGTSVVRPTQLIAEALLDQHDSTELTSKARLLGLPNDLTEAVVAVCCRNRPGQQGANCGKSDPQS